MINALFFDRTDAFYIRLATISPKLIKSGPILKKWQQFLKFKMAAAALFSFGKCACFDLTVVFYIGIARFSSNLVMIGPIL